MYVFIYILHVFFYISAWGGPVPPSSLFGCSSYVSSLRSKICVAGLLGTPLLPPTTPRSAPLPIPGDREAPGATQVAPDRNTKKTTQKCIPFKDVTISCQSKCASQWTSILISALRPKWEKKTQHGVVGPGNRREDLRNRAQSMEGHLNLSKLSTDRWLLD